MAEDKTVQKFRSIFNNLEIKPSVLAYQLTSLPISVQKRFVDMLGYYFHFWANRVDGGNYSEDDFELAMTCKRYVDAQNLNLVNRQSIDDDPPGVL